MLHVGPLSFDPATSRRLRARFLAGHGWGDAAAIEGQLERRDELLAGAQRVLIWVEHDLFDQLQLLQILAQVPEEADVELVQADDFLGPLDAAALAALWSGRRPVPPATRRAARDAWQAVTEGRLDVDVPELPYLSPALRRLAEERQPLSRTKHQLLTLLRDGPKTPLELFVANQQLEEAPFLGDAWCFVFLRELEQAGLVRGFDSMSFELTHEGRQLV